MVFRSATSRRLDIIPGPPPSMALFARGSCQHTLDTIRTDHDTHGLPPWSLRATCDERAGAWISKNKQACKRWSRPRIVY